MEIAQVEEERKWEKDSKGRFQTGNIGGGRKKGSRNLLGQAFVDALYQDFLEHGDETIARVREDDPAAYLKVIAHILPHKVEAELDHSVKIVFPPSKSAQELEALHHANLKTIEHQPVTTPTPTKGR